MNKKRSEWANEEGSALVLTLMIFLVLTVLATSISFLTVGSFRLSDINRDGTSAFYIAEAGAKKAYEEASQEVMKTYEATTTTTSSNFYEALNDALFLNEERTFSFANQFGDDATANVRFTATGRNPQKYTLTSTGSVGGKTRTVQKQFDVSWVDKGGSGGFPALPSEKTVLMTQGEITFTGSAKLLEGDIHTSSTGPGSITFSGNANISNSTLFYPKNKDNIFVHQGSAKGPTLEGTDNVIQFGGYKKMIDDYVVPIVKEGTLPDKFFYANNQNNYLIKDGKINYVSGFPEPGNTNNYEVNITKDVKLSAIHVGNGKTLKINPNGGNRVITVEELHVDWNGTIEIVGDGMITLVINKSLLLNDGSKINTQNKREQLLIVYTGINWIPENNNNNGVHTAKFANITHANLIVKNQDVLLDMNNAEFHGVILTNAKNVTFNGWRNDPSIVLLIAPYSNVVLNNLNTEGSIIADTATIQGNASLTYNLAINKYGFPVGSGGATSTPTLEDLIKQSGPILEQ